MVLDPVSFSLTVILAVSLIVLSVGVAIKCGKRPTTGGSGSGIDENEDEDNKEEEVSL